MESGGFSSRSELEQRVTEFQSAFARIEGEIGKIIVGTSDVVRLTLAAIFGGGHVLLEGVPGLGKTLLVKSIARTLGLSFKRIQFTPDLMPSDVTGTQVLTEDEAGKRRFVFKQGPIFANIVLADEINRATPKTQAALLEAMEERQITVLNETHQLSKPFFVLATQNPIELEGTYPLPEAQLDRFLVKLLVRPPSSAQLKDILSRTTGSSVPMAAPAFNSDEVVSRIEGMKQLVRQVVVADPMLEVLVRIIAAVTPGSQYATEAVRKYVRFGPGPRGAQAVMMIAKVFAVLDSRINLSFDDIKQALLPALRHRLILNFQAEADGVSADSILEEIRNAR
ncbi:MAG: AAA family ATPase [Proteobacteria bacterium]|nr:AAA family ATPase [Pseudomonadota bacterium]